MCININFYCYKRFRFINPCKVHLPRKAYCSYTSSAMAVISLKSISKGYRVAKIHRGFWGSARSLFSRDKEEIMALSDVSFEIEEGDFVGYIGQNGAGKSTTIKILSGILVPTSGEVKVLGKTPWKSRIEVVREIGVVFGQKTQLWWDLPVIQSFDLLQKIYRIPDEIYRKKVAQLDRILDLGGLFLVPVRQLSLGQRMRCDLAASLLHSPRILFLDEPTIGLDATSKLAVRDFLRRLNREMKTTIFLTTHDMDDIESLCKRVIILKEGKIYLDGSLNDLRRKVAPERILVVDMVKEEPFVLCLNGAKLIKQEGHRVYLSFDPTTMPAADLISSVVSKYPIRDLMIENLPIEEIIAKIYRGP